MKNKEIKKLALLGIAAGVMMANQSEMEAIENSRSINLDYVLAKPSCKAHGGCGGLTANRDVNHKADEDSDIEESEKEDDSSESA